MAFNPSGKTNDTDIRVYFIQYGHYHNADLNASHNIAQWEGFSCSLELQQDAAVMVSSATENESLGKARSSDTSLVTGNSVKNCLRSGDSQ